MRPVDLISCRATKVDIINSIEVSNEPVTISASHKVVSEQPHAGKCISNVEILRVSEKDSKEKTIYINITVESEFQISDPSLSKEDLHQYAVKESFPFLRATLSSVMTACGFSPIFLPTSIIGK